MNKESFFLLVSFLYIANICFADVIITKDDELFKVFNVEIGNNTIFYQTENSPESPILKMPKMDVYMVKYDDGTRVIIEEESLQVRNDVQQANNPTTKDIIPTPEELKLAEENNKKLIEQWNNAPRILKQYYDKKGRPIKDQPGPVLKIYGVTEGSQLCDPFVQVDFYPLLYLSRWEPSMNKTVSHKETTYGYFSSTAAAELSMWSYKNYAVRVTIKNLSDKFIYVDMANCFRLSGSYTETMYDATIQTTTNASAVGGGIGIVGGGSGKAVTNTKSQARIVAIPPQGTVALPYLLDQFIGGIPYASTATTEGMCGDTIGLMKTFEDIPTAKHMSVIISYSFSESGENLHSIKTAFFLHHALRLGSKHERWQLKEECRGGLIF